MFRKCEQDLKVYKINILKEGKNEWVPKLKARYPW